MAGRTPGALMLQDDLTAFEGFHGALAVTFPRDGSPPEMIRLDPMYENQACDFLKAGPKPKNPQELDGFFVKIIYFIARRSPSQGTLPLPISQLAYHEIAKELGLPNETLNILDTGLATVYESSSVDGDSDKKAIVIQKNATGVFSPSIVLAYNAGLRSTAAMVFGLDLDEAKEMIENFQAMQLPSHWSSLPLSAFLTSGCGFSRGLQRRHGELWATEEEHGMSEMSTRSQAINLKSTDFAQHTRNLNSCVTELANFRQIAVSTVNVLNKVSDIIAQEVADGLLDPKTAQALSSKSTYLITWHEGMVVRCDYLIERAKTSLQTVHNLVAQRDAEINRDIAQDSARDAATMRIIAAATLVFLPMTATATFFSPSFFDFKPKDGQSFNPLWLGVYFAVTVPLTMAVTGFWRVQQSRIMNASDGASTTKAETDTEKQSI